MNRGTGRNILGRLLQWLCSKGAKGKETLKTRLTADQAVAIARASMGDAIAAGRPLWGAAVRHDDRLIWSVSEVVVDGSLYVEIDDATGDVIEQGHRGGRAPVSYPPIGNKPFDEVVSLLLAYYLDPTGQLSIDGLWMRAVLESVSAGQIVDPPVDLLKELSKPERAWDMPVWPADARGERLAAIAECTLLAIALQDAQWMRQLRDVWDAPEGSCESTDVSQGQIDVALTGTAASWGDEGLEALFEYGPLSKDAPNDRAWAALFHRDWAAARAEVEAYRAKLDAERRRWSSTRGHAALGILLDANRVLRLELRALEAVLKGRE